MHFDLELIMPASADLNRGLTLVVRSLFISKKPCSSFFKMTTPHGLRLQGWDCAK